MYKIHPSSFNRLRDLYIHTYPVDNRDLVMDFDVVSWSSWYDIDDQDEDDNKRYLLGLSYPPYSNLDFVEEIPKGGIELKISRVLTNKRHEMIALYLTQQPSVWFSSKKERFLF